MYKMYVEVKYESSKNTCRRPMYLYIYNIQPCKTLQPRASYPSRAPIVYIYGYIIVCIQHHTKHFIVQY